ncbi:hypothetical protein [Mycobacterium sp. GA-2829]|uniref:hypothetical protein n=1 Tax=Mycobacterium sp. GA-2829 TaxID=1772283 RepID=UPI0012F98407|nr:hypothetical protein [Mycobacterium sp. GA-2829]
MAATTGLLLSPTASADELCGFTLTAPEVAHMAYGVDLVTATLTPGKCPGKTAVNSVTVCVAAAGQPGRCKSEPGNNVAKIFLEHTARGAVYTATGKGCSRYGDPIQSTCVTYGPAQATL